MSDQQDSRYEGWLNVAQINVRLSRMPKHRLEIGRQAPLMLFPELRAVGIDAHGAAYHGPMHGPVREEA